MSLRVSIIIQCNLAMDPHSAILNLSLKPWRTAEATLCLRTPTTSLESAPVCQSIQLYTLLKPILTVRNHLPNGKDYFRLYNLVTFQLQVFFPKYYILFVVYVFLLQNNNYIIQFVYKVKLYLLFCLYYIYFIYYYLFVTHSSRWMEIQTM